jgi:hypothetical protein
MTAEAPTTTFPVAIEEPVSVFAKEEKKHFTCYEATLVGVTAISGGIPSDPNMIKGWLQRNAKVVSGDQQHKHLIVNTIRDLGYDIEELREMEASGNDLQEILDKATDVVAADNKVVQFARTPLGELAMGSRNIKAMLKEAAAEVYPTKFFSKETGRLMEKMDPRKGKTLKSLLAEWVYPEPELVGFGVTDPDEVVSQVGHTSNGAHISIFEVLHNWTLTFQISVLHDLIREDVWPGLWVQSEKGGLGANRSGGYGQFKITQWERL